MSPHNIGRVLRTARTDRGLSLRQLAQLVHFSPGHLSKVENGVKPPSLELAMACDRVLDPSPPMSELAAQQTAAPVLAPRRPRLVPAQLPHAPADFVGRNTELATMHGAVSHGRTPRCWVLTGEVHTGKSALAVHFGHQVAHRFTDGQLYLDLLGSTPDTALTTATALTHLLIGLGAEPGEIPEHVHDRVAMYRSLVAGRNILLVLDDAADSDQVRLLLPGTGPSLVVVTSRNRLFGLVTREGARQIRVAYLCERLGRRLLTELLGVDRLAEDPAAATELVHLLGGRPLAIRAAAVRLGDRPAMPIADYVTELRTARR